MTEHSIKELKRQLDDAASRKIQSQRDYTAAYDRHHSAQCKATKLIGKVATFGNRSIFIKDLEFAGDRVIWLKGVRIKRDGTPGGSPAGMNYQNGITFSQLYSEEVEGGATAAEATAPINAINQPNEEKPASGEGE